MSCFETEAQQDINAEDDDEVLLAVLPDRVSDACLTTRRANYNPDDYSKHKKNPPLFP